MALVSHVNTKRAPEAEVMEIVPPGWTNTWHPVSHRDVVLSLNKAVENTGLRVLNREYSLNRLGTRMFASWAVELIGGRDSRIGYELGIRNAMDKSMALGVCAGTRVFVCDNLAFSSEYVAFRKHTGGLDIPELEMLAQRALLSATSNMRKELDWMKSLEDVTLGPLRFKEIVFDLMSGGILPPSQFEPFMEHWEEERQTTNGFTLSVVYNAMTRLVRGKSLIKIAKVTGMLRDFISRRL